MSQELTDFMHFKNNQLHHIDFTTGVIDAKGGRWGNHIYGNIGSTNPDGYDRLWCNRKLRMKHRLVYFLYHGELPNKGEELDHHNSIRNANHISNLQVLTKSQNNTGCTNRKFGKQFAKATIITICELLKDTDLSDQSIANQTGVTRATVRDIKTRRSRQSIGSKYQWAHRGY